MTQRIGFAARWMFETTGSLTHQTARAGLWLTIGDASTRAAAFIKILVLARLLSPADFGIMGVALLVTNWIQYFTELGFNAALIQKRDDIRPYLNTAWTIQVIRTVGLGIVVALGAPLAGRAFGEVAAVPVLQVLALEVLIRGLANPAVVYLRKDLDTRREVAWRATSAVAGLGVGILAAFVLRNVWALVVSLLVASCVDTVMSYWARPYLPSLQIDRARAGELVRFGRWIFSFRAVGFVADNFDALIVGKVLGATPLGYYQMAIQFSLVPASSLGVQLHGVMFPALARIDNDRWRRTAFLRALRISSTIVLPVGLFVTVFGDFIVELALGPTWSGIAPLIGLLVWVGVLRSQMTMINSFLLAIGRPDLHFRATLPKLVILVTGVYPAAIFYGLRGVALLLLAATMAGFSYQIFLLAGSASFSPWDLAATSLGGIIGCLPFAASWVVLAAFSPPMPVVVALSTAGSIALVATAVYTAISGRVATRPPSMGATP
jgi:O-antigen/teichoic acid export membrane protein